MDEIVHSHREKIARRASKQLEQRRSPQMVDGKDLTKSDAIYYLKREKKGGKREAGYEKTIKVQFLSIYSRKEKGTVRESCLRRYKDCVEKKFFFMNWAKLNIFLRIFIEP